jgi:hypothetical protein
MRQERGSYFGTFKTQVIAECARADTLLFLLR